MIEVEAKVFVAEDDGLAVSAIREKIKKFGKYIGTEDKIDDYYALGTGKTEITRYPSKSLRVRQRKGVYEVNFKQKLSKVHGVHAKNEVEFHVSDIERFLALIREFGFKVWLRKEKQSEIYEVENNLHIEFNNVQGLGWFVEIEYLALPSEVDKARMEVLNLVKLLGFRESDIIEQGYTKLLWDKNKMTGKTKVVPGGIKKVGGSSEEKNKKKWVQEVNE